MNGKSRVLVICTGNSMRSQLAEGVLRAELGDFVDVFSAGTHPSSVHPLILSALEESGIDTSRCIAKSVREFVHERWDLVITLCDNARECCPMFSNAREVLHIGYPDPISYLGVKSASEAISDLRERMRSELVEFVVKELQIDRGSAH
ncbi:MAG: arsenate reductase ArsC [bacterium]|nr:arsenate reductase ArsC [bacterium]